MEIDRMPTSTSQTADEDGLVNGHGNLVSFTFSGVYDKDRPILIDATDPSRSVSRRKAYNLVAALAGAFEAESTVCLHLSNDVLYPVLVLAILASQCRWTGTNTAYTATELEHHFRTSATKYAITTAEHLETVQAAVLLSGIATEIVMFADLLDEQLLHSTHDKHTERPVEPSESDGQTLRSLRDLLHPPSHIDLHDMLRSISLKHTAALMPTSGTTGLPKVAVRTLRSMMCELEAIASGDSCKPYEVRRLFCTPIFHAFSAPETLFNALRLGHVSYFMRRFDDTFAQKVHDFRITETFESALCRLRRGTIGAELCRRFLSMFDVPPRLIPVYGMTEGGWFTTFKHPEKDETGSVGRAIPGFEISISPASHTEPDDQPGSGEVLVRGPQIMQGYLGNAEAAPAAFEDGWLKTGDIGYLEDGKLFLIDRVKDMIKVNGWQVSPVEIENVLLQLEDVLEAAVFGEGWAAEEHPVACVVRRGVSVTADRVRKHLSANLAAYKVRACEIRFVDGIPKSSTGKVVKGLLKKQVFVE